MHKKLKASTIILLLTIIWETAYAAGSFDPCGLLTKAEVEALVGEPVKDSEMKETKNPLGQKMCLYTTVSSSRLIQISVVRTDDMAPAIQKQGQRAAKIYNSTKEMLDPVKMVPGVGDDACWGTPGLHIIKGDVYVLISVGNTSKPENLDLARRIAEKVLPRL
ncbi:MAG: hypothetical protein WA151_12835 [Desulfatirhabdiaceae bacterium]